MAVSAGFAGSSYGVNPLESFDFSYTFATPDSITGTFDHVSGVLWGNLDADPNFVDNVTVQSIFINGTPFVGSITPNQQNGGTYASWPVTVSFTAVDNNFLMWDPALQTEWFLMKPNGQANFKLLSGSATVGADNDPGNNGNPTVLGKWTLTADGLVPDGASTAMLCGMSLVVLGLLRRKLA